MPKKCRKSAEKCRKSSRKVVIATATMIFVGPKILFRSSKIMFRSPKILFRGRWNIVPRPLERFLSESTGIAVAISGRSGGKVVIKPSFPPLSNTFIYR